uniref:Putative kat8 regulatory nsl complex subunit 3 n=1 Tax=Corethrella appendiculata TaxID=1370023 RepID=U5EQX1_9DIPT
MEHSYSRDFRPNSENSLQTRTLIVQRPPQCPSCHVHSHDEGIDIEEQYNPPIPSYDEENAETAMNESEIVTKNVKNSNPEDVDWEEKINKFGWTVQQIKLFSKVSSLLDLDRLARLANAEKQHEPVHRRVIIDKSVDRLRRALANVAWDTRLTQWLHHLLLDNLPPTYLSAYLDIIQTLKAKVPTLVEKMIFGRPGTVNQDLMAQMIKKPWEPIVAHKNRKLPGQPYIVVVPSGPNVQTKNLRLQKWYSLFATMASVVPIQMPTGPHQNKAAMQTICEQMVSITRAKIQDIRHESPNRPILLVGFNAGASVAIQVGFVELVNCIVSIGFAYNTVHGPRGTQDDRIIESTAPILFIIGQNSAKSSQEEIEFMREKMVAQTNLVVIGSADDCLRVGKHKRKIEGITQSMVDNMVMDEIAEFATACLLNPPKPKPSSKDNNGQNKNLLIPRKRKGSEGSESEFLPRPKFTKGPKPKKTPTVSKTPKITLAQPSTEILNAAIESILPQAEEQEEIDINPNAPIVTSYEIPIVEKMELSTESQVVSGIASSPIMLPMIKREKSTATTTNTIKVVPPNQFVQLKPATSGGATKIYTIKNTTLTKSVTPASKVQTSTPKIMNLKNSSSSSAGQSFSPTKFTIMRNTGQAIPSSPSSNDTSSKSTTLSATSTPDLSHTSIIDMPVIFADNDGNIEESITTAQKPQTISIQKLPALKTTTVTGTPTINKQQKFVILNKNALPPGIITAKHQIPIKYIPNAATSQTTTKLSPTAIGSATKNLAQIIDAKKIQIVGAGSSTNQTSSSGATQIIRVAAPGTTPTPIKIIPQSSTSASSSNTIYIKANNLGSGGSTTTVKPAAILNRNITVKKIVNVVKPGQTSSFSKTGEKK